MTTKEDKASKGESPESVAKRQATYRQKQLKEGLVRAQIWVTPEEKAYLNTKLETLRKSKSLRDNSESNDLTKDILSGQFSKHIKKWTKRNTDRYYSNAFFNTDEYSYGKLKTLFPGKLPDAWLVFKLKNLKNYPIMRLRGLGDPTVVCAILHCLLIWYFDSLQQYERRKKVIDFKQFEIDVGIKRIIYKAKSNLTVDLNNTPFAFFMQPISIESGSITVKEFESLDTDQLLMVVDDELRVTKCSDKAFSFEDILRWSHSICSPINDNSLNVLQSRQSFMQSLVDLFMVGIENEIPTIYKKRANNLDFQVNLLRNRPS